MRQLKLIVLLLTFLRNAQTEEARKIDAENELNELIDRTIKNAEHHPCLRKCEEGAAPMICKYHFTVEWYQILSKACYDCPYNQTHCLLPHCIPGDGKKRPILVVNRQMPGTAVEVCLGDQIEAVIENNLLDESTSVHWHGHYQKGTPYMDGVPFITQCPIPPKTSFEYRYTADTPGTHFWHSHSALQRGEGMFGAFIIRVPTSKDPHADLYDFDLPEHTMVILDWPHTSGVPMFVAHHHSDGDNKPESILINGKGRYVEFEDLEGNVFTTPLEIFRVQQGFRYRFRIINAGFLNCPIEISIDNHTLVIISSDGNDLDPIEAESLVTYAGERFDVIVEMNQPVDNYWIRYKGLMDCDERFTSAYQSAVLRYSGTNDTDPEGEVTYDNTHREGLQINSLNVGYQGNNTRIVPEMRSLNDSKNDPRLKEKPDYKFYIAYDFYPVDNPMFHSDHYGFYKVNDSSQRTFTPQFNHISMKFPPFPLMVEQALSSKLEFCNSSTVDEDCNEKYCECTHVLKVPLDSIVELILIDKGFTYDANHPFHLHGHAFRVIGMDRLGTNVTLKKIKKLDAEGKLLRNFDRPPIKDTVTVPDGGYTILRWAASNPGYWLFHCHIEYHVELGMAIVFKVGEHHEFPPVPPKFPRCNNFAPNDPEQSFEYKIFDKKSVTEIEFEPISISSTTITTTTPKFYIIVMVSIKLFIL